MNKYTLGLSCYYHDSAAALLKNGEIVAAAQEERFTRKKHDPSFPRNAILFCLKKQEISLSDVNEVVYYEKPLLTFERPQLSLLIITSVLETNKIEPKSYSVIPC